MPPVDIPTHDVNYALMCSQLPDGTKIVLQTDAAGNIPVSTANAVRSKFAEARISRMVDIPGNAQPLAAVKTLASSLWLQAKKVDGVNTGNVYVGINGLAFGSVEDRDLASLDYYEYPLGESKFVDLNEIYIDAATADDGVVGGYVPYTEA